MANTGVIQMLGNSAAFSHSSEDSKPANGQGSTVGIEWDHQSRGADAGTAFLQFCHGTGLKIALLSQ